MLNFAGNKKFQPNLLVWYWNVHSMEPRAGSRTGVIGLQIRSSTLELTRQIYYLIFIQLVAEVGNRTRLITGHEPVLCFQLIFSALYIYNNFNRNNFKNIEQKINYFL